MMKTKPKGSEEMVTSYPINKKINTYGVYSWRSHKLYTKKGKTKFGQEKSLWEVDVFSSSPNRRKKSVAFCVSTSIRCRVIVPRRSHVIAGVTPSPASSTFRLYPQSLHMRLDNSTDCQVREYTQMEKICTSTQRDYVSVWKQVEKCILIFVFLTAREISNDEWKYEESTTTTEKKRKILFLVLLVEFPR